MTEHRIRGWLRPALNPAAAAPPLRPGWNCGVPRNPHVMWSSKLWQPAVLLPASCLSNVAVTAPASAPRPRS